MGVLLGLGLTNTCERGCDRCTDGQPPRNLNLITLEQVCETLDVEGILLDSGESSLHPRYPEALDSLMKRGVPISLTTHGPSVAALTDNTLLRLHDVEVPIDLPTAAGTDEAFGDGAWEEAHATLARCRDLGVPTTVVATLTRGNHRELADLSELAAERGALLRVRLSTGGDHGSDLPSYEEFWGAVEDLLRRSRLVACSEPVVAAAAGLATAGPACGRTSVRITSSGAVLPCLGWPEPLGWAPGIAKHGKAALADVVPEDPSERPHRCVWCDGWASCAGGCVSRRRWGPASGTGEVSEPFCPGRQNVDLRDVVVLASGGARLHARGECSLLVRS